MTDPIIPPLKRRKKDGQEVGPYRVRINGERIDLGTEDYSVARARAAEAMMGKRAWEVVTQSSGSPNADNWTADLGDAASTVETPIGEMPEDISGESGTYIPPGATEETPTDEPGVSTKISPEFFDGILGQCASMLVELQLMGHEWMAKRFARVQLGPVPAEGPQAIARKAGTEMWKAALKDMFPDEIPLPPYILAPLMVAALGLPVQAAGATIIPEEPAQDPPQ